MHFIIFVPNSDPKKLLQAENVILNECLMRFPTFQHSLNSETSCYRHYCKITVSKCDMNYGCPGHIEYIRLGETEAKRR